MRSKFSFLMNHWLNVMSTDIAGTSVDQCVTRYKEMLERARRERGSQKTFEAEFITADCSKVQHSRPSMKCGKYAGLSQIV